MDTASLTLTAPTPSAGSARHFLMCAPTAFGVDYEINPWMHRAVPVDRNRALHQWHGLVERYRAHGHRVSLLTPTPDQPDMVFAANGAVVIDGLAWLARFRHPERRGEEAGFADGLAALGYRVVSARSVHEGEGDFALCGERLLAGTGFRTAPEAHAEAARVFGREVIGLRLVDPRFYHLDMALCVLGGERLMYYPGAFDAESQALLARRYPDALRADARDALAFGLNATSDGRRVFLAEEAADLAQRLAAEGFEPVPVALSELRRGGGGLKCCTLELRDP